MTPYLTRPQAVEPPDDGLVGELLRTLRAYPVVWGPLPSIPPHSLEAPGYTTGKVLRDVRQAADTITSLRNQLAERAAWAQAWHQEVETISTLIGKGEPDAGETAAAVQQLVADYSDLKAKVSALEQAQPVRDAEIERACNAYALGVSAGIHWKVNFGALLRDFVERRTSSQAAPPTAEAAES